MIHNDSRRLGDERARGRVLLGNIQAARLEVLFE